MSRLNRKDEHLYHSLAKIPGQADFSDVHFIHNCLPDLDLSEINLQTKILGRTFRSPLFLNALTGGTHFATRINALLAMVARQFALPMAVGSQMTALESCKALNSYRIVRRINPAGEIWANLGSYAEPNMVEEAVKMIRADAIQIHLNVAQELFMKEGDRCFRGARDRIRAIVQCAGVPVIVKEVGFGVSLEQAKALFDAGVSAIDIGGKGGTNFLEIESHRAGRRLSPNLLNWGMPSVISLLEAKSVACNKVEIFAAGGINSGYLAAKALAIGAGAVGMAGLPLNILMRRGPRALAAKIRAIEAELRTVMLLLGVPTIEKLQRVPLVITGSTAEWMIRRGIDPGYYATRHLQETGRVENNEH